MKDPCDKCLVSVMCSQVCWDKANYDTLLKSAMNHAKQMINKKTRKTDIYTDEFLKYHKKYNDHKETLLIIKFRKESLKK